MQLNNHMLAQLAQHPASNVALPKYNRQLVQAGIVHVGVGGFHRSHQAYYIDELLHLPNAQEWGICGICMMESDRKMYETLQVQDGLYTLMVKEFDGTTSYRVVGSIVEYLFAPEQTEEVIDKMAASTTKIISLTITEGGYNYNEATDGFDFDNPHIQHDLKQPKQPKTIFGYLAAALRKRMDHGVKGLTIQSCDNIQENGHLARRMLHSYLEVADPALLTWVEEHVAFPNSMVDRITPVTTTKDIASLQKATQIVDSWPVVCEPFQQWIMEEEFSNGRPELEKLGNGGIQYVRNVEAYEKMKLSLLNAGHSVLGIIGALLGYSTIDEAINDNTLCAFLRSYLDEEVTPILDEVEGIDLSAYKASLIERFSNQHIKDQIARICSETSAKLPIFLLPTVHAQLAESGEVKHAAFVVAAWARYSLGLDEKGQTLEIKDVMQAALAANAIKAKEDPLAFLDLETVFGSLKTAPAFASAYHFSYKQIATWGVAAAMKRLEQKVDTPASYASSH